MNVEIGTKAEQFLFWEYLFRIFGIVFLQCIDTQPLEGTVDIFPSPFSISLFPQFPNSFVFYPQKHLCPLLA